MSRTLGQVGYDAMRKQLEKRLGSVTEGIEDPIAREIIENACTWPEQPAALREDWEAIGRAIRDALIETPCAVCGAEHSEACPFV